MKKQIKVKSLATRLTLIIMIMILVSSVGVGVMGYVLYRGDTIQLGADRALAIAESTAAGIDGDAMEKMMASGETTKKYKSMKAFADGVMTETQVEFIYILGSEYDTDMTYFIEGYDPESVETELLFGDTEAASYYAEEMFTTLSTGEKTTTDAYPSGEYGTMVSGFAPITSSSGKVVGVVGVDLLVDDVLTAADNFGLRTILIVVITCIVMGVISTYLLRRQVGQPIGKLTAASRKFALGDMNFDIDIHSQDEIGELADSFREMADSTGKQVELLERLAQGDLTIQVNARSENDTLSNALQSTVDDLRGMFSQINQGTNQVSTAAAQIADGAQVLATGSIEQAATVEKILAAINQVAEKTEENANKAHKASELSDNVRAGAAQSAEQMRNMVQAVNEIDDASHQIEKVMMAIDDIAAQTNILALNAAVEAARAGEHGKGFAVVAEEVRALAAKSAESAKTSASMIENSLQKSALGVQLAGDTEASLLAIIDDIDANEKLVTEIADASVEQNSMITEINNGMDEVSQVVNQNSATAEESAATSEEMSSQSALLKQLADHFKLDDTPALGAHQETPEIGW